MTSRLQITANQITALCKGAEKAGFVPVVQIGNTLVRLIPETHAVNIADEKPVSKEQDFRL